MKHYLEIAANMEKAGNEAKRPYLECLFKLYDDDQALKKAIEDCENGNYNGYEFDECSMLLGLVEFDSSDYPFLKDYLNEKMSNVFVENTAHLSSCEGYAITVNWNAGRNEYFIYDQETHKPVVQKHNSELPEEYYHAIIEEYQRKQGVFNHVVNVDRYGQYLSHLETKLGNKTDEELKAILESFKTNED